MSWNPFPSLATASREFLQSRSAAHHDALVSLETLNFYLILAFAYSAQFKLYDACGGKTLSGPFAGLRLPRPLEATSIQELMPVSGGTLNISGLLLGHYEAELHLPIERLIAERSYDLMVDVGCSTGYYAVGMAMRMQSLQVEARDTNIEAHKSVRQLADLNNVGDRVRVGGEWSHSDFALTTSFRTLVFCDIEGDELTLLDPEAAPELKRCDIVVEMHDAFNPSISEILLSRFEQTHSIKVLRNHCVRCPIPPEIDVLTMHERTAVLADLRLGPTPWAVMLAYSRGER